MASRMKDMMKRSSSSPSGGCTPSKVVWTRAASDVTQATLPPLPSGPLPINQPVIVDPSLRSTSPKEPSKGYQKQGRATSSRTLDSDSLDYLTFSALKDVTSKMVQLAAMPGAMVRERGRSNEMVCRSLRLVMSLEWCQEVWGWDLVKCGQ
uniref:Uncharacterized protein n=1 Tax=Cannabis sativa TaxID=3483 RepID=A0A803NRI8_CANSA